MTLISTMSAIVIASLVQIAAHCALLILGLRIRKEQRAIAVLQAQLAHQDLLDLLHVEQPSANSADLAQRTRERLLPDAVKCLRKSDPEAYDQWLATQIQQRVRPDS
jgi:folate-binding Fe-S cluster repair protein YgfZ